jgi:hypothetical protein
MVLRIGQLIVGCALAMAVFFGVAASTAFACPFCTALKPTWSQRREAARVVVLAELTDLSGQNATLRLHQSFKGKEILAGQNSLTVQLDSTAKRRSLILLLGDGTEGQAPDELKWSAVPVDETSLVYYVRAPSLRVPPRERLRYFIPYLEHADAAVADDAYLEFGHAPYDQVADVAAHLPMPKVRQWLTDPSVLAEHKGLYGLMLGLARTETDLQANRELLERLIGEPAGDFRSGFDGLLGGYLVLLGEPALEQIERRFLASQKAAEGDIRHAMTALRFYAEYGRDIPRSRLGTALAHLLSRPEFAAAAIVDLARWQAWEMLSQVAILYDRADYPQPPTNRAVIGYLLACPQEQAGRELERLRMSDPQGVAEAERSINLFGGNR